MLVRREGAEDDLVRFLGQLVSHDLILGAAQHPGLLGLVELDLLEPGGGQLQLRRVELEAPGHGAAKLCLNSHVTVESMFCEEKKPHKNSRENVPLTEKYMQERWGLFSECDKHNMHFRHRNFNV